MGQITYFCLKVNDFVINEEAAAQIIQKNRSGWKKGDPNYESHRRKIKKELEVQA